MSKSIGFVFLKSTYQLILLVIWINMQRLIQFQSLTVNLSSQKKCLHLLIYQIREETCILPLLSVLIKYIFLYTSNFHMQYYARVILLFFFQKLPTFDDDLCRDSCSLYFSISSSARFRRTSVALWEVVCCFCCLFNWSNSL